MIFNNYERCDWKQCQHDNAASDGPNLVSRSNNLPRPRFQNQQAIENYLLEMFGKHDKNVKEQKLKKAEKMDPISSIRSLWQKNKKLDQMLTKLQQTISQRECVSQHQLNSVLDTIRKMENKNENKTLWRENEKVVRKIIDVQNILAQRKCVNQKELEEVLSAIQIIKNKESKQRSEMKKMKETLIKVVKNQQHVKKQSDKHIEYLQRKIDQQQKEMQKQFKAYQDTLNKFQDTLQHIQPSPDQLNMKRKQKQYRSCGTQASTNISSEELHALKTEKKVLKKEKLQRLYIKKKAHKFTIDNIEKKIHHKEILKIQGNIERDEFVMGYRPLFSLKFGCGSVGYVSAYFSFCKGPMDNTLQWPFRGQIQITMEGNGINAQLVLDTKKETRSKIL